MNQTSDSEQCSNRLQLDIIMVPKGSHIVISVSVRPFVRYRFCLMGDISLLIMAPKRSHIVISVSVRSFVRSFVRYKFCLMGSSLCSLLLQNYSTYLSNAVTNLRREQGRFATYTSF